MKPYNEQIAQIKAEIARHEAERGRLKTILLRLNANGHETLRDEIASLENRLSCLRDAATSIIGLRNMGENVASAAQDLLENLEAMVRIWWDGSHIRGEGREEFRALHPDAPIFKAEEAIKKARFG